ncbi:transglycosylase SLT domain-containing protein [Nonomuraea sp. NPDC004297]
MTTPAVTLTITDLPRGGELKALHDKVTGNVAGIRSIASAWRSCSHRTAHVTSALIRNINEVDLKWEGDSADAFDRHIRLYPQAGGAFNAAVGTCAKALDDIAATMEKAAADIATLSTNAVTTAQQHLANYKTQNPAASDADAKGALIADATLTGLMNGNITSAQAHVTTAENTIATAMTTLDTHLKLEPTQGFGFFTAIPPPGGPDFVPGEQKVVWTATAAESGTQAQGGAGAGSGSGSGGGGAAPTSGTPAAKTEVVEWIKQALTVIRSPEMADVMRERGIDVGDLDPNDPQDVQRIWTIIYHESGGNPSAINNWDINAKNGIPSQGLMQTIPPTFNAHALPGHGKILDPVDNIIAGVLYTYSRYGNLGGHPGISSLEGGGSYRPY